GCCRRAAGGPAGGVATGPMRIGARGRDAAPRGPISDRPL
ncbi:MAG: hypothetical protein AVDCRST_MAG19-4328, partial [uncultured Thermomicrobiales bacterium]